MANINSPIVYPNALSEPIYRAVERKQTPWMYDLYKIDLGISAYFEIDICNYVDLQGTWSGKEPGDGRYTVSSYSASGERTVSATFTRSAANSDSLYTTNDTYLNEYNQPTNIYISYSLVTTRSGYKYYNLILNGVYLNTYLNPGGYPDGSPYESQYLIGVPEKYDSHRNAYFNGFIYEIAYRNAFTASIYSFYDWDGEQILGGVIKNFSADALFKYNSEKTLILSFYDPFGVSPIWDDYNLGEPLHKCVVGIAYVPTGQFISTDNIIQPYNQSEQWNIRTDFNDGGTYFNIFGDETQFGKMSGCLELPSMKVPGTINDNGVYRNYYKLADDVYNESYIDRPRIVSGAFESMYLTPLYKTLYGYSSGGGFVQMLLADGFPDNKVHWQLRYVDLDFNIKWFASEESYTPVSGIVSGAINPVSAHYYGLRNCTFGNVNY